MWSVGSHSIGPPAGGTFDLMSTEYRNQGAVLPCRSQTCFNFDVQINDHWSPNSLLRPRLMLLQLLGRRRLLLPGDPHHRHVVLRRRLLRVRRQPVQLQVGRVQRAAVDAAARVGCCWRPARLEPGGPRLRAPRLLRPLVCCLDLE